MVVYLWCYGAIFLPLVLGPLLRSTALHPVPGHFSQKPGCLCQEAEDWPQVDLPARQQRQAQKKSTKKWLTNHKINILQWPSQSPDLKPIENLWLELKRAVDKTRRWTSRIWKGEEWSEIPPNVLQLIKHFRKSISAIILARWGIERYWKRVWLVSNFDPNFVREKRDYFLWASQIWFGIQCSSVFELFILYSIFLLIFIKGVNNSDLHYIALPKEDHRKRER